MKSNTARFREIGAELRKRREAAGISATEVARYNGWTKSRVSRIEAGLTELTRVDVIHYLGGCRIYRAEAMDLLAMCRDTEDHQGYWLTPAGMLVPHMLDSLIYHESTATSVLAYEPMGVHGLLQTAAYAHPLIAQETWRSPEDMEALVQVRMQRKDILVRPRPAAFTFFLHEQGLRNIVGGNAVMHDQLMQVAILAGLPNVTLRVVPTSRVEQGALGNAFQFMTFARHGPLIYMDGTFSGLFVEEKDFVAPYPDILIPRIAAAALDEGESRAFVAELASDVDPGGQAADGGIYHVEEEQLQPGWR